MKTYLKYSGLAVQSHRGGSLESPENTLESFSYSQSIGCKYIETDVQISLDGIPYIFHDETLTRILKKDIIFSSLHSSEIDRLSIFNNHPIPTLEKALNDFPEMFFQIDVKTDEVAIPALEIIKKCNAIDRVCIASFNSKRLNNVYKNYPEVCLSMGPIEVFKLLLASFNLYSKDIQGDCLQVPIYQYGFIKIVTQRFVKYVQNRGLKISVWTINDPKTLKKLIDMKVDGIITDKPKLLMELLEN